MKGRDSNATPSASQMRKDNTPKLVVPITWATDTGPDQDNIQALVYGHDVYIGYQIDFEGDADGPSTFSMDPQHLDDFIALLQRVKDSL